MSSTRGRRFRPGATCRRSQQRRCRATGSGSWIIRRRNFARPGKLWRSGWSRSNAHHCNLILNVAPNREGRFDQNALDRLAEVGRLWRDRAPAPRLATAREITTPNLASARPSYASSIADTSSQTWQTMMSRERTGSAIPDKRRGGLRLICKNRPYSTRLRSLSQPISATTGRTAALFRIVSKRGGEGSGERCWLASHPGDGVRMKPTTAERVRLSLRGTGKPPGIAVA